MVGDRLLITPHAAWSSPESVADARRLAAENAAHLREGRLRTWEYAADASAPHESTG
jgi:phosphoglycerate dehydrogenase-like enzyme